MAIFIARSRAGIEALCHILAGLEHDQRPFNSGEVRRKPPTTAPKFKGAKVIDIRAGRKGRTQ